MNLDAIAMLLGLYQYYRPETPCLWTWARLMNKTEARYG